MSPPAPPPFNAVDADIAAAVPAVVVVVAVVGVAGVVVFDVVVVVLAPFDCSGLRLSLGVIVVAGDAVVSLLFLLL